MSAVDYKPFAAPLPPGRARIIPPATVIAGSLLTVLPIVATVTILPPAGLVMLLAWRLLARFSLKPWAAAPLGLFDDLVSGQPLGSAVLLWSLCFIGIDLVEQRLVFRDFWQDWLIASAAIAFALIMGRIIAVPIGTHVDAMLVAQIVATLMLFPLAARIVARIDRKRGDPA